MTLISKGKLLGAGAVLFGAVAAAYLLLTNTRPQSAVNFLSAEGI